MNQWKARTNFPGLSLGLLQLQEDLKLVNLVLWGEIRKWNRKNVELFQYTLHNDSNIFYIMIARLISLQRRVRVRWEHNERRQKEGHLPWRILEIRATLRKRRLCYSEDKNAWWWNRSLDKSEQVRRMTTLLQAKPVPISVGTFLRDVGWKGHEKGFWFCSQQRCGF